MAKYKLKLTLTDGSVVTTTNAIEISPSISSITIEKQEIEFVIRNGGTYSDATYKAAPGMTWSAWLASEYNDLMLDPVVAEPWHSCQYGYFGYNTEVMNTAQPDVYRFLFTDSQGTGVLLTDQIIEGNVYIVSWYWD